jgi:hypothetical protein
MRCGASTTPLAMLELNHFFTQITLTLNAECTALLIDQITAKPRGNRTGCANHRIKGRDTIYRSGQAHEQADTGETIVTQPRQVK